MKQTTYIAMAYSYYIGFYDRFQFKAMPTNDTDYSCHIKITEPV